MTEHTPLPWRMYRDDYGDHRIRSATNHAVACELDEDDAELIVRAVNSHARLLDACRSAYEDATSRPTPQISVKTLLQLRDAIEAAEEK